MAALDGLNVEWRLPGVYRLPYHCYALQQQLAMGAQSHQGCWEPAERRGGGGAAAEAAEEAEAEGVEPGEIPACHLEPSVAELFEEGLRRLEHRDTWKLWRWPASDAVFYTPDEYKCAPWQIVCPCS